MRPLSGMTTSSPVPAVDQQHHGTLICSTNLATPCLPRRTTAKPSWPICMATCWPTPVHFTDEEELMAQSGLDPRHVDDHRAMHQQFIQQVTLLWSQRAAHDRPRHHLVGFLTSWLGLHILGMDEWMARQIRLRATGPHPRSRLCTRA